MTPFHLHRANFCQVKDNTIYPIEEAITDLDSFKRTVSYDHVMSKHRNDHRSNDDFIESDVPIMDVDETKSLVDLKIAMQGIEHYTATSRHHQQWKHAQAPCDRFHSYFAIPKVTDQVVLVRLLADMHNSSPSPALALPKKPWAGFEGSTRIEKSESCKTEIATMRQPRSSS